MLQLQILVVKHDLLVISDEVYEHIVFDGATHQSAASYEELAKHSFITASFGKTFHNTGWKMGYCFGPETIDERISKVHQYNVFVWTIRYKKGWQVTWKPNHYLGLSAFMRKARLFFRNRSSIPDLNTILQRNLFSIVGLFGNYLGRRCGFCRTIDQAFQAGHHSHFGFQQKSQDFKLLLNLFCQNRMRLWKQVATILKSI